MYVKELSENMLVVPAPGACWQFASADEKSLIKNGIAGHLLLHTGTRNIPGYKNLGRDAAVYMYCRIDQWMWGGIFRHHYMLVNGMVCIVDGYQFKDIEPLEKND